ncbi:MAG: type II CAAX endopeptidase family protein [Clostridium sp.]
METQEIRNEVRHVCSFIGFSLCLLFVLTQLLGMAINLFSDYLASYRVMGIGAEIYKILNSDWFSTAGANLLIYAVTLPALKLVLHHVPEVKAEPKKMRVQKILLFFVLSMGTGYVFNMLGNFINLLLSGMTGRNILDMTPITDMLDGMHWTAAIYIGMIGPIIEEYIFRGLILNRMRPYGERAAIIFSAVLFGLLHGNVSQFFYATALGIIFGYVAAKTGRILYSSILHIMVNSYSVILAFTVFSDSFSQGFISILGSLFISGVSFILIAAAIAIFIANRKKTRLGRGNLPSGVEYRDFSSAMFVNPGVIILAILCFALILFYIFLA